MDEIGRCRPAHGVHVDLGRPTIIFLTVCTKGRAPWLACDEAHETLRAAWDLAEAWQIGRYVLLPDHVHLFCAPNDPDVSLETWVRFWKRSFRKRTAREAWRWQPHHWDTRLRRGESYAEKWDYVRRNPVRAGLVAHADDWPYQGELHILPW